MHRLRSPGLYTKPGDELYDQLVFSVAALVQLERIAAKKNFSTRMTLHGERAVDDDVETPAAWGASCAADGFEVRSARDGQSALRMFVESPVDVVVADACR